MRALVLIALLAGCTSTAPELECTDWQVVERCILFGRGGVSCTPTPECQHWKVKGQP